MKKIITIVLVISIFQLVTSRGFAQDTHFTMYDAMPVLINPATAGVFGGDIRAVVNYRNQWASIGNPYTTFSMMVDGGILKNKWKKGYIGWGVNILKDVAGQTSFGTTKISLALSSVVYLNDKNSASVGLMGAWGQNSISQNGLQWDSQFNGLAYDQNLSSNENFSFNSSSFVDFSAGGLWTYGSSTKTLSSNDDFSMKAGFSFYHVNTPNRQLDFGIADNLYSKLTIHSEAHIGIANTNLAIEPKILTYLQGPARQVIMGVMFRYMLKEESKYTGMYKEMAISVGSYYRVGDAFAPSFVFEVASYAIGFSYDFNVSGLTSATGGNGGPEVFIKFSNPNPFKAGRGSKSNARFR